MLSRIDGGCYSQGVSAVCCPSSISKQSAVCDKEKSLEKPDICGYERNDLAVYNIGFNKGIYKHDDKKI